MKKNKKTETSLINFLKKSAEKIVSELNLGKFSIYVEENEGQNIGNTVLLLVNHSKKYKTINIWFHPRVKKLWENKKVDILVQAITHEIAHVITNGLADMAKDRFRTEREIDECVEETTETVAGMIRDLLELRKIKLI